MKTISDLSKPVNQLEWEALFPAGKQLPQEQDEFELGLVLGGTVSAGAYTAGVLDFLIEALDAWEEAREPNSSTPSWKVRIKVVSGTSGGGVLATILAKTIPWDFPPVRKGTIAETRSNNLFYQVWVDSLNINDMLKVDDLTGAKRLRSLLNASCIELMAGAVANYPQGKPAITRSKHRPYFSDPLTVFLTLTNITGIPYLVDYGNGLSQNYTDHADFARFAFFKGNTTSPIRPDEFGISPNIQPGFLAWDTVAQFALATAAFPVGLPPRELSRPIEHYRYRPVVIPADKVVRQLTPDWSRLAIPNTQNVADQYHFLSVDGGVMDNEPIELCRQELAGMLGRNPRDGIQAQRAVLLIDPFAETPALGPNSYPGFAKAFGDLIGSWKDQVRYDSQDIMLAFDPDCFSRFMITAVRDGVVGGKAIATASLGAFGGFLCEEYRKHDFFLGRKNCQDFLKKVLVLPEDNGLFADWKNKHPTEIQKYIVLDSKGRQCLPLIPLFGLCLCPETAMPYPMNAFNPKNRIFREALQARVEAALKKTEDELPLRGFWTHLLLSIGRFFGQSSVADAINDEICAGLKDWNLL